MTVEHRCPWCERALEEHEDPCGGCTGRLVWVLDDDLERSHVFPSALLPLHAPPVPPAIRVPRSDPLAAIGWPAYLEAPLGCPRCGTPRVDAGFLADEERGKPVQWHGCESCGAEWSVWPCGLPTAPPAARWLASRAR